MSEVTKTVNLGQNGEIKVTFNAFWINSTNADGHVVNTPRKLHTSQTVRLAAHSGLRKLREGNKFDAPHIAKGAVAMIGHQPIGQATYDKVCAAIEAAKAEAMDADMLRHMADTEAARAKNLKADMAHEAHVATVYNMMDA